MSMTDNSINHASPVWTRLGHAEVLLIEDNPGDVSLVRSAFAEVKPDVHITVVQAGDQAMAHLRHAGEPGHAPRPNLILLDLNLPGRDGMEVLAEIKGDHALRQIPVVVMTSSRSDMDTYVAYDLGANCYLVKPFDFGHLRELVRRIEEFWLGTALMPEPS